MSDPLNAPVMYEMTSEQYAEQIRGAEKRGAVKALSEVLQRLDAEHQSYRDYAARDHGPDPKRHFMSVAYGIGVARGIVADAIERDGMSGEVTFP